MNKKPFNRMIKKFNSSPPRSSEHGWSNVQGGNARRRPELKLAGGYATAVKAKQGSRVRLNIEGIVTGVEGSPRQKPNMTIAVEKVRQRRS